MRFCLALLVLFSLSFCFVPSFSLPTTAVAPDVTTVLPPPHQPATIGCKLSKCGTMTLSNFGTSDNGWSPLQNATVTLSIPNGMMGYLLYAAAPNGKHVGTLTVKSGTGQSFDASTNAGSTLQHSTSAVQTKVVATWTAPQDPGTSTPLTFNVLIMENMNTSYILSQTVQQTNDAQAVTTKAPATTTTTKKTAATTTTTTTTTTAAVVNCFLIVPANALTAAGLATPFLLATDPTGNTPCTMTNSGTQAFVQGSILDVDTGKIYIYNPLVIDAAVPVPAVAPTAPTLPKNNVVGLWFGFNGGQLTLKNSPGTTSVTQANCVNGVNGSPFTQFGYCNAVNYFNGISTAYANGLIATTANAAQIKAVTGTAPGTVVPALATASDGEPCPTLRDFTLVDMDQSDNLDTKYLLTTTGLVAQNTAANTKSLKTATVIQNPGDNPLLTSQIDVVYKCAASTFTAPDLADNMNPVNALPLSEIQATLYQNFPVARVPALDPMVLVNGAMNLQKLNNYRLGVYQTPVQQLGQANTACYCKFMVMLQPARLMKNSAALALATSFVAGQNLFQFMVTRFNQAIGPCGLNCPQFGVNSAFTVTNPVYMPIDHKRGSHVSSRFSSLSSSHNKEELYVWHYVPEMQNVKRMHVLDESGAQTTITVDMDMMASYDNITMPDIYEAIDHDSGLGDEMNAFIDPNVVSLITDPGTETAGDMGTTSPGTTTDSGSSSFFSTTTGLAVIIGAGAVGAIIIIGIGAYCYSQQRKQHASTVSRMGRSQM